MKKSKGFGVVVGRFQVPELHEAHKQIINVAKLNHEKLMVFIACTVVKGSDRDPLDYETRFNMIKYEFPDAIIRPIWDSPSDRAWSQDLDGQIIKEAGKAPVMLYSGHMGFASSYSGRFRVTHMKEINFYRGTEIREVSGKIVPNSKEARCGVMYGIVHQYPRAYPTVDIAVVRKEDGERKVLLGLKPNSKGLRFPGGFVDPTDDSLEEAARREVREECGGIDTGDYVYLTSMKIDDWRYKGRRDQIITTFFKCEYLMGSYFDACKGNDAEFHHLDFYPINSQTMRNMATNHKELFKHLLKSEKSTKKVTQEDEVRV